ncbi:MAG: hypothetical protein U1E76_09200 [Planctomycetota bacterium]
MTYRVERLRGERWLPERIGDPTFATVQAARSMLGSFWRDGAAPDGHYRIVDAQTGDIAATVELPGPDFIEPRPRGER